MTYVLVLLILVGLYVILASSFNLVIGYAGLISIAHPAFFAIGAYASGLLARDLGWPPLAAVPVAALLAAFGSVLVSLPALRVSGDYLMIASLGFQLGLIELIKNLSFSGGSGGLTGIPPLLAGQIGVGGYAALVLLSAAAIVWLIHRIMRSDYGRAVTALRDDEVAASMLGRDPVWIKLWVIALASGIAGYAGALYAHYFRFVSPEQFDVLQSSALLTMVVVGGIRTTWGPLIGAALLETLPQLISYLDLPPNILGPMQGLLFTTLVLVFMFFRPGGLIRSGTVWRGAKSGEATLVPRG
jgi:branched-chain amino acid transport system permease protein